MVPLYDVPIIPTLPVVQEAAVRIEPSRVVYAGTRPASQSITAFAASVSLRPPDVGQPSEWPVPGDSACTTAKPRGTQVDSYRVLITGLVLNASQNGARGGPAGGIPSSWSTFQLLYSAAVLA